MHLEKFWHQMAHCMSTCKSEIRETIMVYILTSQGRQVGTAHPMIFEAARRRDFDVDYRGRRPQSVGTSTQTPPAHEHASLD